MEYGLPTKVKICGEYYSVRYDFRVILDIFEALNDPNLNENERAIAVLTMFYPDYETISDYEAAIKELYKFISCGEETEKGQKHGKLIDWQQDFKLIVSPINQILGKEIRSIPYDLDTNTGGLHWWTFVSAFQEIGDCFFAQVVRIRNKKARWKKLDKSEQEFYRQNKDIISIKTRYSEKEEELIAQITGRKE